MRGAFRDVGLFVYKEFDKIILIVILSVGLFRASDGANLASDFAKEAFAALLGFMQGRKGTNANQIGNNNSSQ